MKHAASSTAHKTYPRTQTISMNGATSRPHSLQKVWPVTVIDMVDLGPSLSLRKNKRSWSAGYRYSGVPKCELEATQFVFVCPCPPHLHGLVAVL